MTIIISLTENIYIDLIVVKVPEICSKYQNIVQNVYRMYMKTAKFAANLVPHCSDIR